MNKQRRKEIQAIRDKLEDLTSKIAELRDGIDTIKDDEQEYYDNMPESLQSSDRGTAAEEAVSHLDTALEALDEIANQASEATEALDSAMA